MAELGIDQQEQLLQTITTTDWIKFYEEVERAEDLGGHALVEAVNALMIEVVSLQELVVTERSAHAEALQARPAASEAEPSQRMDETSIYRALANGLSKLEHLASLPASEFIEVVSEMTASISSDMSKG